MVHFAFNPASVSIDDFIQQGAGYYFHGFPNQRGYGKFSSFKGRGLADQFSRFKRFWLPMIKGAGKLIGNEALITGARILDNIAQGAELKETVKSEAKQGVKRLAKKFNQEGSGAPPSKKRKIAAKPKSKPKSKPKKKKRITKKSLLGQKVLKDIVLKNPISKYGMF